MSHDLSKFNINQRPPEWVEGWELGWKEGSEAGRADFVELINLVSTDGKTVLIDDILPFLKGKETTTRTAGKVAPQHDPTP